MNLIYKSAQAEDLWGYIWSPALVAVPIGSQPCLIELDQNAIPELKTADLPFVSIGSGMQVCDSLFALVRRSLWKDGPLPAINLALGRLLAIWSVRHAIESCPGYVSDPLQVMILEKRDKKNWKVTELDDTILGEHEQFGQDIEHAIKTSFEKIDPTGLKEGLEVPKPSPSGTGI